MSSFLKTRLNRANDHFLLQLWQVMYERQTLIDCLLKVNIYFPFLVSDTIAGESNFYGGSCLPMSDGALCVKNRSFYRLHCTTTACTWSKMSMQLEVTGHWATVMYLPKEYSCLGWLLSNFSYEYIIWNLLNLFWLSEHDAIVNFRLSNMHLCCK